MTLEEMAKQVIQQGRTLRRADMLVIAERGKPGEAYAKAIKRSVYREFIRLSEQHELAETRAIAALENER